LTLHSKIRIGTAFVDVLAIASLHSKSPHKIPCETSSEVATFMKTSRFFIPLCLSLSLTVSCERQAAPPAPEVPADPNASLNLQLEIQKEMLALERERLQADRDAALAEAASAREALNQARSDQALAEAQSRAAQAEKALAEVRAQEANARAEGIAAEREARAQEIAARPQPQPQMPAPPRARPVEQTYAEGPDYSLFYRELAPHGPWFQTAEYGYVWQPEVARRSPQWRPYTDGRWLDTDQGWAWWSEEPFGWATYHYGRWTEIARLGWIWVPGPDWAPAWVSWRVSNDYIGWAPLPPVTVYETTFNYGARTDSACGIPPYHYNFVPTGTFAEPVRSHTMSSAQSLTIIEETTNVTNIHVHEQNVIVEGPRPEPLRREFGSRLPHHELSRQDWSPGTRVQDRTAPRQDGGRLEYLAPRVAPASVEQAKPSLLGGIIEQLLPAHSAGRPDAGLIQNFARERARVETAPVAMTPERTTAPKPATPAAPAVPAKGKGKEPSAPDRPRPADRPKSETKGSAPARPSEGQPRPKPINQPKEPSNATRKGNPDNPPKPRPAPMPTARPQDGKEKAPAPATPPAPMPLPAITPKSLPESEALKPPTFPAPMPIPAPAPETAATPEPVPAPEAPTPPAPMPAPAAETSGAPMSAAPEPLPAAEPVETKTEDDANKSAAPMPANEPAPESEITPAPQNAEAPNRPKGKPGKERKEKGKRGEERDR
jgi:hypothetical protein